MKFKLSKTIGIVLGSLVVISSIGYAFLYLLGTSLGNALGSNLETTTIDIITLGIILCSGLLGVLTGIGCFGLKIKEIRRVYIGFCLIMGIVLLVIFSISIGALGTKYEFTIFIMGILYLLLGYIVIKEK